MNSRYRAFAEPRMILRRVFRKWSSSGGWVSIVLRDILRGHPLASLLRCSNQRSWLSLDGVSPTEMGIVPQH